MSRKVAVNACYGGFGLSNKALHKYAKALNKQLFVYVEQEKQKDKSIWERDYERVPLENFLKNNHAFYACCTKDLGDNPTAAEINKAYTDNLMLVDDVIARDDPVLIKIIEELGSEADGFCAELRIAEIPDDVEWCISEYDGLEHVEEKHRSW